MGDNLSVSANLELVRSIYAAWERRDYVWVEWADPAIDFAVADGPSPGHWTGLAGMWKGWQEILEPWEDWRVDQLEYRELDAELVLVFVRLGGRGKTSGLEVADLTREAANLFRIRDGRVRSLTLYWDRDRVLADLGLVPDDGPPDP